MNGHLQASSAAPKAKNASDDESSSSSSSEDEEEQVKQVKKVAKVQPKEESDSDSSEGEDDEEEKPAPKLSGKKRKASDDHKHNKRQKLSHNENGTSIRTPFSRIKHDYAEALPTGLQDNTFEAKARYGKGGDNYGIHSNEKLRTTVGKDFRKGKTKMKKKNFHGAGNRLTYTCNSIKL